MRASSHSVAEKIRKACSDSSELFFKTREEAESRLKTLKLKKDKEIRKNFKKWRRTKRKEARKLRAQNKKQVKKKEILKKRREDKSREAYKKWCEMRNKGMYWSKERKQPCEIPYDVNGDDHTIKDKKETEGEKSKEAWVNTVDNVDECLVERRDTTRKADINNENSLLEYYYGDAANDD